VSRSDQRSRPDDSDDRVLWKALRRSHFASAPENAPTTTSPGFKLLRAPAARTALGMRLWLPSDRRRTRNPTTRRAGRRLNPQVATPNREFFGLARRKHPHSLDERLFTCTEDHAANVLPSWEVGDCSCSGSGICPPRLQLNAARLRPNAFFGDRFHDSWPRRTLSH
jgi:hypothetical protein